MSVLTERTAPWAHSEGMIPRMTVFLAAGLLALTGCSASTRGDDTEKHSGSVTQEAQESPDAPEDVPSALDDPSNPEFPAPLVDPDDIVSGGPPPDGIPAIDHPMFERVGNVHWLAASEPVLVLTVGA